MNPRFLEYYRNELTYIREHAGEFAREFPKIAGRLELDASGSDVCPDPFVERLLEGFAYLAARVQLKFDAEYPRLLQAFFDAVLPNYLAPLPSMAMVAIEPDYTEADLAQGYEIPRHTELRSRLGRGERTPCVYRTAHGVTLYPLRIVEARYYERDLGVLHLPDDSGMKSVIRIRLEATGGANIADLKTEALEFFVRGLDTFPEMVLETIFAHLAGVGYRDAGENRGWAGCLPGDVLQPVGIGPGEAILPVQRRVFSGYRLLREFFAFRQRFHFFRLTGLRKAFEAVGSNRIDLFLLLRQSRVELDARIDKGTFSLFTTPVVNLFERRADPIQLTRDRNEYPIIVDKTRSFDFEVFSVSEVVGKGSLAEERVPFHPFYFSTDRGLSRKSHYALRRAPRMPTSKERRFGKTSDYTGSDLFISLVDATCLPYHPDLQQLSLRILATNRHLPLTVFTAGEPNDFSSDLGGPVAGYRCIVDPTTPAPSVSEGEFAWRLVSHLSLNHYSLVDAEGGRGAVALREILRLYGDLSKKEVQHEIEALLSVDARAVTRRLPSDGPIAFGRGLEVHLTFNEKRMEGLGLYSIGLVLARFLAKHVSVNSFAETIIHSEQRGEVIQWKNLSGLSPIA